MAATAAEAALAVKAADTPVTVAVAREVVATAVEVAELDRLLRSRRLGADSLKP